MTRHECDECGWTPDPDNPFPEDALIDHYEDEHL